MPNLKAEIVYIDLGVAIGAILDMASDYADLDEYKEETITMCARELRKLPTIDPASLRQKGEWITMSYWKKRRGHHVQYVVKKCSLCNFRVKARWENNFCPNCGADMRKEVASDIMVQPMEGADDN